MLHIVSCNLPKDNHFLLQQTHRQAKAEGMTR